MKLESPYKCSTMTPGNALILGSIGQGSSSQVTKTLRAWVFALLWVLASSSCYFAPGSPAGVQSIAISVFLLVCLSVCRLPSQKPHYTLYEYYLWPWLSRPPTTVPQVMHFRFRGWRNIFTYWGPLVKKQRWRVRFVKFSRWQHRDEVAVYTTASLLIKLLFSSPTYCEVWRSACLCLRVCSLSQKHGLHAQTSRNFCTSVVAVDQSFSDTMQYVMLVLLAVWMTSFFHIMGPMGQNQTTTLCFVQFARSAKFAVCDCIVKSN